MSLNFQYDLNLCSMISLFLLLFSILYSNSLLCWDLWMTFFIVLLIYEYFYYYCYRLFHTVPVSINYKYAVFRFRPHPRFSYPYPYPSQYSIESERSIIIKSITGTSFAKKFDKISMSRLINQSSVDENIAIYLQYGLLVRRFNNNIKIKLYIAMPLLLWRFSKKKVNKSL